MTRNAKAQLSIETFPYDLDNVHVCQQFPIDSE